MLEVMRRGQRWVMTGVILLVGGVFVFYLGLGGAMPGGGAGGSAIKVGKRRYTLSDLQRTRDNQEAQLRESLGDSFDPSAAGPYLDQIAAERLIQRAVLANEAERLGFAASDPEVRNAVRSNPAFVRPDGRLDAEQVGRFAESVYGSEARFADEVRVDLLVSKVLRLIEQTADVSDAEALESLRHRLEELKLAYVALDPTAPADDLMVEDAQIARALADERERLRVFYDENLDRYQQPERVRARHVLVRVEPGASEAEVEAARQKAESLRQRIANGEDFAAVAREASDDPGSAAQGGDLDFFARGQMVPPFEQAAFSLPEGELSELVRSDFGFHVIEVMDKSEASEQSFEEVVREIAETVVRGDLARRRAGERAEALAEAVAAGASLTDAAREMGLTLERTDWLRRRGDGYVEGLGAAADVLTEAFSMGENGSSPRIFEIGERRVLIERLDHRTAEPEVLAEQLDAERARLQEERSRAAQQLWYQAARQRLQQRGELFVDLSALGS